MRAAKSGLCGRRILLDTPLSEPRMDGQAVRPLSSEGRGIPFGTRPIPRTSQTGSRRNLGEPCLESVDGVGVGDSPCRICVWLVGLGWAAWDGLGGLGWGR
jgi:hypothetical protein